MSVIDSKNQLMGWHWQYMLRTYSFWGLALIAFLMGFSEFESSMRTSSAHTETGVDFKLYIRFYDLGAYIAGLLMLYLLRTRLKAALIIFTLTYLISLIFFYFGFVMNAVTFWVATLLKVIGRFGILLTILSILVTARPPLKSFLMAYIIIWGCILAGNHLGIFSENIRFTHEVIDGSGDSAGFDAFYRRIISLIPSILMGLTACFLKVDMLSRRPDPKKKNQLAQKHQNNQSPETNQSELQSAGWLWQDIVSSYRFWGLVLISFLMGFSEIASSFGVLALNFGEDLDTNIYSNFTYLGMVLAAILTLYIFNMRQKAGLLIFAIMYLIPLCLLYTLQLGNPIAFTLASAFKTAGYHGILLTILAAIISARSPIKSFLIAYIIIWFWAYVGQSLGYAYDSIGFSYTPIDDAKTPPFSYLFYTRIAKVIPVILVILAALFLNKKMFLDPPNFTVTPKVSPLPNRDPFWVSVMSVFIPFYFLYWLYKRPGELKTLLPNMHQPSPIGAVCIGMFAPLVLPFWFHDVRKGLGEPLRERSARRIGVVGFLIPAFAAGMAQSDYNLLAQNDD